MPFIMLIYKTYLWEVTISIFRIRPYLWGKKNNNYKSSHGICLFYLNKTRQVIGRKDKQNLQRKEPFRGLGINYYFFFFLKKGANYSN